MEKIVGKVFSTKMSKRAKGEPPIGEKLSALRRLAGLTQAELAQRLYIGQTALSKMEQREDILISSLKNYIEALGASLQIDASFKSGSSLVGSLEEAFDMEFSRDDQLVFPIFDDEYFRSQRDVILSIKPEYSEQIIDGTKKVELRRRFPVNVPDGTRAYIYSTSPTRALTGVATIKGVSKRPVDELWETFSHVAGIERSKFDDYFSGLENGYVIVFSQARPLKRSIDLPELRTRFNFEPPQSFIYAKPVMRKVLEYECSDLSH